MAGQLVGGPLVTIITPDPSPGEPTLAESPSGDSFLAVWTDGGGAINGVAVPEAIWTSVVQPAAGGAGCSAPVQLTANGNCPVAAWNGTGFSVVWADGSGLHLQQLDTTGALLAASAHVMATPGADACPTSLIATDAGLALSWYDGQAPPGELAVLREVVALVNASGSVDAQIVLGTVGPGVAVGLTLGELQGQTYAAAVQWPDGPDGNPETVVTAIDWSSGTAGTATVIGAGFYDSFFTAGGQLEVGLPGPPVDAGGPPSSGGLTLYESPPGGPIQLEGQVNGGLAAAADACGRLVVLGAGGPNPSGVEPGFFAQSLSGTASRVSLGAVSEFAFVGGGSTFGVLWWAGFGRSNGALNFTALSWQ
jgi:hypothetical protein